MAAAAAAVAVAAAWPAHGWLWKAGRRRWFSDSVVMAAKLTVFDRCYYLFYGNAAVHR